MNLINDQITYNYIHCLMQLVPGEVGSAAVKIPVALHVVLSEEDLFANRFSVNSPHFLCF
jgi:hypothetical protein